MSEEGRDAPQRVPFRPDVLEVTEEGPGRLIGSRCASCGAHYFPGRRACARCLGEDMRTVPLSTEGTVYTYTVVHQSTPAFEVPYVLGYVDLPEGVRVLGQITGCDPGDVRIGMAVVLTIEPFGEDEEGRELAGYRFRPAPTEADHD